MSRSKTSPPTLLPNSVTDHEFRAARRQKFLTRRYFDLNEQWLALLDADAAAETVRRRADGNRRPLGQRVATFNALHRILLRYTAGAPIEQLLPLLNDLMQWLGLWFSGYSEYLAALECGAADHAVRNDVSPLEIDESLEDYQTVMTMTSLAVLMGNSDATVELAGLLSEFRDHDLLLETLLEPAMPGPSNVETFYHEDPYDPLLDAAYTATSPAEASAFVQKYLSNWYRAFSGTYWHDGHLVKKEHMSPYHGYWSFEAAAVCVLCGIDDASFRDHLAYPKDLADWARRNNSAGKLKAAASRHTSIEQPRLRCLAGDPCPRTGFWISPARVDSRRHFAAGEPMPDLGGTFGTTIWQWDGIA